MSKTYAARLADAIREILPDDTEFVIEADPPYWGGYIFVTHPNGVNTAFAILARDMRAAITGDVVQEALRSIAYKLRPQRHYTPKWQDLNREAYRLWVAQTGIKL